MPLSLRAGHTWLECGRVARPRCALYPAPPVTCARGPRVAPEMSGSGVESLRVASRSRSDAKVFSFEDADGICPPGLQLALLGAFVFWGCPADDHRPGGLQRQSCAPWPGSVTARCGLGRLRLRPRGGCSRPRLSRSPLHSLPPPSHAFSLTPCPSFPLLLRVQVTGFGDTWVI